ncbi:MAG: metal ABC transporter ATP-binding protein, partial [Mesorhizobium sp.]
MGASLLAMRPCQPTHAQNDTPLSRAGSLPQGLQP